VLNEIKAGPRVLEDGATGEARAGEYGEAIVSQAHGKYYEAASRRRLFFTANQAAKALSIALATTYTGLVVANPRMSSVNLAIVRVGWAESILSVGLATIGLMGGYDADAELGTTTALVVYNCKLLGPHGEANAFHVAELPTAPVWLEHYMGAFTASTLHDTMPVIVDVDGAIIVPPGAYVAIGALVACTGLGSIMWEEIPR